ncbi:hypothetical protein M9Y10_036531 [Tritrichomonas musculus]|uniref:Amino acid permease family protein n=1 Tax=Tritrichomonas musculus TaxID=1915356 RepID=A0ABR2GUB7_9EUKA
MTKIESSFTEDLLNKEESQKMVKAVSILHLVSISFFYVCAGPFGQGEAIAAGGAKWTFIFTFLVPIVFSVPLALISSEQSSRLPACGGCAEWGLILGQFVGVLNAYVRFLCSVFDNPIYPCMIADYLVHFIPQIDKLGYRFLISIVSNAIVLAINISGLETVGSVSFILAIVIIAPFLLFFAFGASEMTPEKVFADKPKKYGPVNWSLMVSTLIWQYSGFDTVSALSEETKNPKRTFPIALFITIVIVILVYILPTISGLSVEPDLEKWASGAFSDISKKLPHCSNGWLGYWISVAGILSGLSMLNIAISCTGRETYAGALLDAFPLSNYLSRLHNNVKKEPLPIISLAFMSVITIPFTLFDFSILVEWSGLLTVIQQLIQVAAYIALRFPSMVQKMKKNQEILRARVEAVEISNIDDSEHEDAESKDVINEDLSDKFIVPGGWLGVAVVCVPITAISIFLCVVAGWMSLVISAAMVAGMFLLKAIERGTKMLVSKCERKNVKEEAEASP